MVGDWVAQWFGQLFAGLPLGLLAGCEAREQAFYREMDGRQRSAVAFGIIGISDGAIYVFLQGHTDSCWVTRFRPHSNHTLPILPASLPRDCIRQSYRRAWTKAERQIVGLDRYEKARRLRWVRRRQSQRRMILCRVTRGVRGEARQGKARHVQDWACVCELVSDMELGGWCMMYGGLELQLSVLSEDIEHGRMPRVISSK